MKIEGGASIFQGVVWTYIGVIFQACLKIVSLGIVARLIAPQEFGLLSYALLCTGVIERIGQLGVGSALVQRQELTHRTTYVARRLNLGLGCAVALGVFVCAGICARFFEQPALHQILQVLSVGCLIEALTVVPDALLQRKMAFKKIVSADNGSYFISMVIICPFLAWKGMGVWALVISILCMKIVRFGLLSMAAPPRGIIGRWDRSRARELLRVGLGFSIARVLNCISLQGDNFVVGKMFGADALGLYTRGYQLMTLPAALLGQIYERVMFPAMSKLQCRSESLNRTFLVSIELMTLLALPAGVILSLCSAEVIVLVFGRNWIGVAPIVSVLSYGVFFRATYKCSDATIRALGAVYRYAVRQGIYSATVLIAVITGAYLEGSIGVAWGVVIAVAVNYATLTCLAVKLLGTSPERLFQAHLPGIALFFWCWLGLAMYLPSVREDTVGDFNMIARCLVGALLIWLTGFIILSLANIGTIPRLVMLYVSRVVKVWRPVIVGFMGPIRNQWR